MAILPPDGHLVVDLSEVTFMECAGLGPLLMARHRLGDHFWLRDPSATVLRLLDLAGVVDEFAVVGGPPDARNP